MNGRGEERDRLTMSCHCFCVRSLLFTLFLKKIRKSISDDIRGAGGGGGEGGEEEQEVEKEKQ